MELTINWTSNLLYQYPAVIILYCANCFFYNMEPYDYDGSRGCKCSSSAIALNCSPVWLPTRRGNSFDFYCLFFCQSACGMWWLYSWDLDRCMNIVVILGPLQILNEVLRILFRIFANSWTESLPPIFHNLGPLPILIEILHILFMRFANSFNLQVAYPRDIAQAIANWNNII